MTLGMAAVGTLSRGRLVCTLGEGVLGKAEACGLSVLRVTCMAHGRGTLEGLGPRGGCSRNLRQL